MLESAFFKLKKNVAEWEYWFLFNAENKRKTKQNQTSCWSVCLSILVISFPSSLRISSGPLGEQIIFKKAVKWIKQTKQK